MEDYYENVFLEKNNFSGSVDLQSLPPNLEYLGLSDNQIEQELPIKINFTKDEDLLQSTWEINNNSHQNDFTRIANIRF